MLAEKIPNQFAETTTTPLMADDRPVSIIWATSLLEKEAAYKIRYKVYCERLGYENTTKNPDKMEMDQYDGWSKHLLVRDDISGDYIGTIRVVKPASEDQGIPLERHYQGTYNSTQLDPINQKPGQYIELSRLAVDKTAATRYSKKYATDVARLLYLTAIAYFQHSTQLSHLFWLSEKWLSRRLTMLGILSTQIGSFFEFKGQRAPYMMQKTSAGQAQNFTGHAPLELRNTSRELYDKIAALKLHCVNT